MKSDSCFAVWLIVLAIHLKKVPPDIHHHGATGIPDSLQAFSGVSPRIGALNTEWMIERGGVEAMQELAITRSRLLYVTGTI